MRAKSYQTEFSRSVALLFEGEWRMRKTILLFLSIVAVALCAAPTFAQVGTAPVVDNNRGLAAIATKPRLLSTTGAVPTCANVGAAHKATATIDRNKRIVFLILHSPSNKSATLRLNSVWYDFARIRYPPPLFQRRSSNTDLTSYRDRISDVRSFSFCALTCAARLPTSLEDAF